MEFLTNCLIFAAFVGFITGAISGFLGGVLISLFRDRSIVIEQEKIKNELLSIRNLYYSERGVQARQANNERMSMALARFAELTKEGKNQGDALKQVASEFPDVALLFAKKYLLK